MNNLYNNNTGFRKASKRRFVGVWECRSGFLKIFCEKIRMFLPRACVCVCMI